MRASIFVFAALLAVACASLDSDAFTAWMASNSKTYNVDEFQYRFQVWKSNKRFIEEWNSNPENTHTVAMNEFGDLSNLEFRNLFNGLRIQADNGERREPEMHSLPTAPTSIDWRSKGAVTGVKNQGQCGSCWSFSTTGSVEGQHFLSGQGSLIGLSEQNLMDCSYAQGNQGCNGGLMDNAFRYIISNKGIDTESSYPYTAQDGHCRYNAANKGASIDSYTNVPSGNEDALTSAIGSIGPISVAIDASHSSFQFYSGGVYFEPGCSSTQLDHGVLAVGYGSESGKDYYIVKNSWGTSWGMNGYILMTRNRNNNCGIATMSSYPVIHH